MQIYGLDVGLRQEPHETNPTVKSNEVRVDLGVLVDFHLHFEVVDFLPNLLSQQRRQTVAGGNISTTVILAAWPGVVELNARAKHDVP